MSQALLALDTDHIKQYVFGTSKLKEIRGASSILDHLNRILTGERVTEMAQTDRFVATKIYANGGSALFLVDADEAELRAEQLGKRIQRLYIEKTGGGASITYAIQPVPEHNEPDILKAKDLGGGVSMKQVLKLLRFRLRLAKETQYQDSSTNQEQEMAECMVLPSHVLLAPCNACGMAYAEEPDPDDSDDPDGRYCQSCIRKRKENREIKSLLTNVKAAALSERTLWGRILHTLQDDAHYDLPLTLTPPKDFHAFRDFATQKGYLGLIYADANGMGRAIEKMETLEEVEHFASTVDTAIFRAMGDAIKAYLPIQGNNLPFDILMIGGDDIVMVTPAEKALHVAYTLAERFHAYTNDEYTLSVGVLLAPISYPFRLQQDLVEETIKAAKKSGAARRMEQKSAQEQSQINFVVVTGNTSLSYKNIHSEMHREKKKQEEFYATLRPYTLPQFKWLLEQLKNGNQQRLGRTKLHQLREAILKKNRTTTILESLALLRNWHQAEREFIKDLVKSFDARPISQQQQETLFPWYRDASRSNAENTIYGTPLLDFIELYDFVSSDLVSF